MISIGLMEGRFKITLERLLETPHKNMVLQDRQEVFILEVNFQPSVINRWTGWSKLW